MPIGKVKWYDPERGFGFASNPGEADVRITKQVLPEGVEELHSGQRIEFDFADGRRGPQALRVSVLDGGRRPEKPPPTYHQEELNSMISDVMTVLETVIQPELARGRWPERKNGRKVAEILRAVARELDK